MSPPAPQALPDLDAFRAVLFDLDGVLTPTADLHMHAWRTMFEELFVQKGVTLPYTDDDYFLHLDGKQRYEGVASLLRSRGIELEWGFPTDPSTADTVCGIGNRKNDVFSRILQEEGVQPYPGSLALLDQLRAKGMRVAIVSSSKNAETVLTAAGIRDRFPVVVDGLVAARETLASKPSPDMFAHAATAVGVAPADAVVFEDAISGVAAARAGTFGLVVGVDRGVGPQALFDAGADVVVADLGEFLEVAE
ncbi:HAD family hydrolase [Lysobacter korlensis]|uniref:Beta-phosphoglucomutase n=1 Tax=Lysobacter korlensis TaxID=553636 RepID=A0ABV6RXW6_9GAMM